MATVHVVSLFLPFTLKFHDEPRASKPSSPPPGFGSATDSMHTEIPSRLSAISLFKEAKAALEPGVSNEDVFAPMAAEPVMRQFAKLGDPHSLVPNDADVSTWGVDRPFNQPYSKAGPLPSGSILDFAEVREALEETPSRASDEEAASLSTTSPSSNERGYGGKAWTVEPPIHGNGALFNAMRAAASDGEFKVRWIGTLGFPTDSIPQDMREDIKQHMNNEYQSEVVYVSDKNFDGHYSGYCKTMLWPVLHYLIPDTPKSKAYCDHSWEFYERVNQAIADKAVASYNTGDKIFIHDYHLLLVPSMVREKLPDAEIGFFLHASFPPLEVFRVLAKRKQLLDGMSGANLVAFQTKQYAQHFLQTCSRLLAVETTEKGVKLPKGFVNVTYQPMGISPKALKEARSVEDVKYWIDILQERYGSKRLIVARDKLDSVHGIRQKLLAYEFFLSMYPEWAGKTVLIQVATSTTEYVELLAEITEISSRIDRAHASLTHRPITLLKQDMDFSAYLALLTAADVLINCSLRDGMNLIGPEYVECQDGSFVGKKHGPLILSEFAGSDTVLRGQISVNPWNKRQVAEAINQALEMNEDEKQQRWKHLHQAVSRHTGAHWAHQLNHTLENVVEEQTLHAWATIPQLSAYELGHVYKRCTRRLFLIDFEGTLVSPRAVKGYQNVQYIVGIVNRLALDPKNTVYVTSGRGTSELGEDLKYAHQTSLVAENGCFLRDMRFEGRHIWENLVNMDHIRATLDAVKNMLTYYLERIEGSYVEERQCSIVFHYEAAGDQAAAIRLSGLCADQINSSGESLGMRAVPVVQAILVEQTVANKATAATRILSDYTEKHGIAPDFVMVAGDDREDEVAFHWANELLKDGVVPNVFTVSMGLRNTEARACMRQTRLPDVLDDLGRNSMKGMPEEDWSWLGLGREGKGEKALL